MSVTQAGGAPTPAAQPLSKGYVNYALWMLLIVYTLNFLDRQIVSILATPIMAELKLTNAEFGLLTGLAFAFVYTVLGIPIAKYSDKFTANRVGVISISLAVWSAFTVLCGAALQFWQMLLARIGVGVGEAGCTPPAHSLIADKVAPEKRASALAFYSMGVPIGTFLGFAFGGLIAQYFGWRWAFVLVGAPGIVLALIVWFTIKEPRKLGLVAPPKASAPAISFGDAFKALKGIRSYWYACFAAAVLAFIGYGQAAFLGRFYGFAHGLELGQIGLALGVVIGLGGAIGTFIGGQLADAAAKRDTRAYFSIPAIGLVIGTPFFIAALLWESGAPGLSGGPLEGTVISLALLTIPVLLNSLWYGPIYASIQGVVPPPLRASAVAIMLFIVNMIGLGFGPLALGVVADFFSADAFKTLGAAAASFNDVCLPIFQDIEKARIFPEEALGLAKQNPALTGACVKGAAEGMRWGILWTSLVGLFAVVLFWMARATIRDDLARARAAA